MNIFKGSYTEQVEYKEKRIKECNSSMIISDSENFLYKKYADKLCQRGLKILKFDSSADNIGFNPLIPKDNAYGIIWKLVDFFIRTENEYCRTAEKNLLHTACVYVMENSKKKIGLFECIREALYLLDTIMKSDNFYRSEYYLRIRKFAEENIHSDTAMGLKAMAFINKKTIRNLVAEITVQMIFSEFIAESGEATDLSVFSEKTVLFINRSYRKGNLDRLNAYLYYYILQEYHFSDKIEMITDLWEENIALYCKCENINVTLLAGKSDRSETKGNAICIMK